MLPNSTVNPCVTPPCIPSGELSFPPFNERMYASPVRGCRQFVLRARNRAQTFFLCVSSSNRSLGKGKSHRLDGVGICVGLEPEQDRVRHWCHGAGWEKDVGQWT